MGKAEDKGEISVYSTQFCCEYKSALTNKEGKASYDHID